MYRLARAVNKHMFEVMTVSHVSQTGGSSLLMRKPCVRSVWPSRRRHNTTSSRRLGRFAVSQSPTQSLSRRPIKSKLQPHQLTMATSPEKPEESCVPATDVENQDPQAWADLEVEIRQSSQDWGEASNPK
ncbi:hypothetical protein J6590_079135 [Homalodisca vitripennis]|nr:hypothetical protein J6590_079135 [Homalodisca vitripennis]